MSDTILKGKKVLLMAPSFYNYYIYIVEKLKKMGAEVDLILEVHDPIYLYFFRKNKCLRNNYTYRYYASRLKNINNIDYIFLIRGEAINCHIMELLLEKYPKAKKVMYQWDSVKNNPNIKEIIKYFDKCYTFDPLDAKKYKWEYRPLFYLEENCKKNDTQCLYDFVFIGTLYFQRAKLLKQLKKICEKNNYRFFYYFFVKKFEYIIHTFLLKDKRYTIIPPKDVNFVSLSNKEVCDIYEKSKIFVDYTAETQAGFTIRTIESIGSHKKIITNNKNIVNADFYNPNNIYVYDLEKFDIPINFVNSPYVELKRELYKKYSLEGWLEDIFMEITSEKSLIE